MSNNSSQSFLTPKTISKLLKVSYPTALAFIKYSGIDYIKIGNQYRVSEEKFNAYIQKKGKQIVYTN
ncbi:MAG: excisionase family DNA-binding protein [Clostridia bacterium]|nr:excisionase family DNA-binding protein [Clostridia bacterium]